MLKSQKNGRETLTRERDSDYREESFTHLMRISSTLQYSSVFHYPTFSGSVQVKNVED